MVYKFAFTNDKIWFFGQKVLALSNLHLYLQCFHGIRFKVSKALDVERQPMLSSYADIGFSHTAPAILRRAHASLRIILHIAERQPAPPAFGSSKAVPPVQQPCTVPQPIHRLPPAQKYKKWTSISSRAKLTSLLTSHTLHKQSNHPVLYQIISGHHGLDSGWI